MPPGMPVKWTGDPHVAPFATITARSHACQQARVVDEANLVFALNIELFDELEGGKRAVLRAMWGVLRDAVRTRLSRL